MKLQVAEGWFLVSTEGLTQNEVAKIIFCHSQRSGWWLDSLVQPDESLHVVVLFDFYLGSNERRN